MATRDEVIHKLVDVVDIQSKSLVNLQKTFGSMIETVSIIKDITGSLERRIQRLEDNVYKTIPEPPKKD